MLRSTVSRPVRLGVKPRVWLKTLIRWRVCLLKVLLAFASAAIFTTVEICASYHLHLRFLHILHGIFYLSFMQSVRCWRLRRSILYTFSQFEVHFATGGQSVSSSWCRCLFESNDQILNFHSSDIYFLLNVGCPLWQEGESEELISLLSMAQLTHYVTSAMNEQIIPFML
jgi:hypothetical protein